jgi:K+-transporting ATPase ATPase A chain
MTNAALVQNVAYLVILLALAKPLGVFMARVYQGERTFLTPVLGPVERVLYRAAGVKEDEEMSWKTYAIAMLVFNFLGFVAVYLLQRFQAALPLNPAHQAAVSPDLSFNTAVSFATNTNWQSYGGETTLSHLTQMLGLTVQNFVSAAAGMAVAAALIRGIARKTAATVGNFWTDMVKSTLYVLLPLSLVLSLAIVSQGVVQNLAAPTTARLLQPTKDDKGKAVATQDISVGPAASQVAIKQLGTNGGGFYNVNSAHPLENPTPLAGFLETIAILLIGAAFCHTFGAMVKDRRQGWALLAVMTIVFVALLVPCWLAEQNGNPRLVSIGVDQAASAMQAGGNMEGKEARFGIGASTLWATATTAASNGSVDSMHDSYTPLGGLVPMVMIQLGEIIFGGVGSGLYGILLFAIIAVFVAGLMVGRTPEYLGKKIESFEMKMAAIGILVPPAVVLIGTAVAVVTKPGLAGMSNPGIHGFSQVLYAFSSAGNNNGSAFGGINANSPFYNAALGLAMLFARYWVALPALAIAGSLARKKTIPAGPGTLPTHGPIFVVLVIGVILLVGALTFVPALALGPIAEHLAMVAPQAGGGPLANR